VCVTAISGLILAHGSSVNPRAERPLAVSGSGSVDEAMPINDLLIASLQAVADRRVRVTTEEGGIRGARGPAAIERARFRPANGTVQVLLRDGQPLEVVLDWSTAQVLSIAPRHQYRWLRVHAAEDVLGEDGTLKRDAIAGLVVLMSLTGIGAWFRDRARADLGRTRLLHRRLGLAVAILLLVPATTGVLMNHRVDLGYTYRPSREFEAEALVKMTPARMRDLVDAAANARAATVPGTTAADIDWLDYFPRVATMTAGFRDGTDVFVDAYSGELRAMHAPRDTWVRKLHTGHLFAGGGVLRDLTALAWIAVTLGGLYLAVRPGREGRLS